MRILIFGQPRTGTTALEFQLASLFHVPGLLEPLHVLANRTHHRAWATALDRGVAKILTNHVISEPRVDIREIISLGVFDHIVITARRDLTASCLSYYYAERVTEQYQWQSQESVSDTQFWCDPTFVRRNFLAELDLYSEIVGWLNQQGIGYSKMFYEDYCVDQLPCTLAGQTFRITDIPQDFQNSKIDYEILCENHDEIDNIITDHLDQYRWVRNTLFNHNLTAT